MENLIEQLNDYGYLDFTYQIYNDELIIDKNISLELDDYKVTFHLELSGIYKTLVSTYMQPEERIIINEYVKITDIKVDTEENLEINYTELEKEIKSLIII